MRTAILLVMVALMAGALGAQANERIRFQGRLTTPAGVAITTATDVSFAMYSVPTGGSAVWTEAHSGASAITPSATGVFTVELGAITAITGVDFAQPVYVGITVGTDAEMTPRYLLTSAAHAHQARNAATLGGLGRTGFAELTGATFTGAVTATGFTGSGAGLTNIPAGQLTGTLPALNGSNLTNVNAATLGGLARTGFAELSGATFTGAVTATQFNGSGAGLTSIPAGQLTGTLPALNGSALTNVSAATLGGLARTGFAELTGATFTGAVTATQFNGSGAGLTSIPAGQLTGTLPALNGSALTNLNASNFSSGALPSARLFGTYSSAVTLNNVTSATIATANVSTLNVNGTQTTTGLQQFADAAGDRFRVPRLASDPATGVSNGMVYYNTASNRMRMYENGAWTDIKSGGAIPTGTIALSANSNDTTLLSAGYTRMPAADAMGTRGPISDLGAPSVRAWHAAVWTGKYMLVWGGLDVAPNYLATGGRYEPAEDRWTPITTTGAPTARMNHTAVWTGSHMLVWGGFDGVHHNTGGSYDPATDTWTTISTTGAPSVRSQHTAVWTGTRMLVWGGWGSGSVLLNTGGSYDPSTNTWTTINVTGAPMERYYHTAVWTGSLMVVWGGHAGFGVLQSGGRYDPTSDTWTPTTFTGAPTHRESHCAVWTGTHMIVWGGHNGVTYLNIGNTYDPVADSWTFISTTAAPSARLGPSAVWTGSRMLVWGGLDAAGRLNTGGSYDPTTDTWSSMSTTEAPRARASHTAVWTGARMLIWGGSADASTRLNSGHGYDPSDVAWGDFVLYAYRAP